MLTAQPQNQALPAVNEAAPNTNWLQTISDPDDANLEYVTILPSPTKPMCWFDTNLYQYCCRPWHEPDRP